MVFDQGSVRHARRAAQEHMESQLETYQRDNIIGKEEPKEDVQHVERA